MNPVHVTKSLARAFGFLGKRWNGVILGTLLNGPAGFSELKRAVGGISDSVLSERLTELAGAGLVTRSVDAGPPITVEYELTGSGQALLPRSQRIDRLGCRESATRELLELTYCL